MDMMEIRHRVLLHQAKQAVQPIYHIENRVCNGDLYDPIDLYTGTSLYTDDWAILIDFTPTKLYTYPVGAYQSFTVYVNWSGICFYNSSLENFTKKWDERTKAVLVHSSTDDTTVHGHSIKDGAYAVTDFRGTAIKDPNNWQLHAGWTNDQISNRAFVGTIHDLTVYHGYIPTQSEINAYLGIS